MNLGHKIYNDLVNRKMTKKNGYSGVFEYYPEITVALLLEHLEHLEVSGSGIRSNKEIICDLTDDDVSDFFKEMLLSSYPEWLYKNQIVSDYEISKKAVENKAFKVFYTISGIKNYKRYKNFAANYGDDKEHSDTVVLPNSQNCKISIEEMAIFCIGSLFREDFLSLLYQILNDKYNIEFSI